MGIPLVRNNSVDDINTSIIAIKKELGKGGSGDMGDVNVNVDVKYEVTDTVEDGNSLPVTSQGVYDYVEGQGFTPVDEVEKNNMKAVTSNAVAESLSYSTTEQKTGKKWIDGKMIYRRVINTTVSGGYNTTTNGYYSWESLGFAEMSTFSVSTMIDAFFIGVGAERGDNKINKNCVMVFNRGANYNQAVYQVNSGYDGFKALQLVIEYTKAD